jgi:hypothetical protein
MAKTLQKSTPMKLKELVNHGLPSSEKRGGKNEGKSHDVTENTYSKNVSFMACHDVDEKKVVVLVLPRCL